MGNGDISSHIPTVAGCANVHGMHLHLRYLRAAVLVAHERSEVGLLGWIILGEALDLAVMMPRNQALRSIVFAQIS